MTLRVAIGPAEVAGTSTALAEGLRAHGVDAEVAFWSPLPGSFPSDRALGRLARAIYAIRAPTRRDVLHYQFGRTWLPWLVDAHWGRVWRRTIVATYHGDDCRLAEVACRLSWPMAPLKDPANDAAVKRQVARMGHLCHAALAADLEVASYVFPYFDRVYVTPVPLHNRLGPAARRPRSDRVVVLHAPSDLRIKGTLGVRAAVENVSRRLPVEYVELSGVPHHTIAKELARADLVVDQLNSVSASVLALEAMRAGLPVLTHLDSRGLAPFHADLPIVPVTSASLERELDALVRDEARRRRLGRAGQAYVARTHAARPAARAVMHVYAHARRAPAGLFEATSDGIRPLHTDVLDEQR